MQEGLITRHRTAAKEEARAQLQHGRRVQRPSRETQLVDGPTPAFEHAEDAQQITFTGYKIEFEFELHGEHIPVPGRDPRR